MDDARIAQLAHLPWSDQRKTLLDDIGVAVARLLSVVPEDDPLVPSLRRVLDSYELDNAGMRPVRASALAAREPAPVLRLVTP